MDIDINDIGKLPLETKVIINDICKKYDVNYERVEKEYKKKFNEPSVSKIYYKSTDITNRHDWARIMLFYDYENKPIMRELDVVFIGSSGTSVFDTSQRRLYVYNARTKQKACISLKGAIVFDPRFQSLELFQLYSKILLAPTKDGWLSLDNRTFPLPEPMPLESKGMMITPSMLMKSMKIRKVKMSEFDDVTKHSKKDTNGKYIYSDIVCIENAFISKSTISTKYFKGENFKLGFMQFTDYTTDGYILDDGTVIPQYISVYTQESEHYDTDSVGNMYGTLRVSQPRDKNKPKRIVFDFCYFNPTIDMRDE